MLGGASAGRCFWLPIRMSAPAFFRIVKVRIRGFACVDGESRDGAWELAACSRIARSNTATAPRRRRRACQRIASMGTMSGHITTGEAWSQSGLKGIFETEAASSP
jgi:hypothetical protein